MGHIDENPYAGHNGPCPCKGGKIYKECCLAGEEHARQELDAHVLASLVTWAYDRSGPGPAPIDAFPIDRTGDVDDAERGFFLRWNFYSYTPVGECLIDRYLVARYHTLSPPEKGWIGAQVEAWMSVWQVVALEPGIGMAMRDLLTHEERFVIDTVASTRLREGSTILARVVEFSGKSCLCGFHPRPVARKIGGPFAEELRQKLRSGRPLAAGAPVPVAWLQDRAAPSFLVGVWKAVVAELLAPAVSPLN